VESTVVAIGDLSIEVWPLEGQHCRQCGKGDGVLLAVNYTVKGGEYDGDKTILAHAVCIVGAILAQPRQWPGSRGGPA
jgi:hypothetical protein